MKKTILLAVGLWLLVPTLLQAQQPEEGVARHAIKANIYSTFFGCPSVSYEYRLSHRSAVQADLGGTLLKNANETLTPYAIFTQAHYRFYLNDQRRSGVMPFLAAGVNYVHAWEHFDCFVRNEGWNIITERYTLRDNKLCPTVAFGLKVNIPFGLTLESTIGVLLMNDRKNVLVSETLGPENYFSTIIATRIGWAF